MIGIRAKRLLSGASAIAMVAAFAAVAPALAAGLDVNGPASTPTIVVPPNLDYIDIDTNANILSNGSGNSIQNAGTIGLLVGTRTAIDIDNSTLQGKIFNSGLITATGAGDDGINAAFSQLLGGINNSGDIGGNDDGIDINGNSDLLGGIFNSGNITGLVGDALFFAADDFSGGIENGSTGVFRGANAINMVGTTFSGGMTNAGELIATNGDGINLNFTLIGGGIENSGLISASGTGIALAGTTFTDGILNTSTGIMSGDGVGIDVNTRAFSGGIENRGQISFEGDGISTHGSDAIFTGGILNSGSIASGATAIHINNASFLGGINNTGTLSAVGAGILIDTSNSDFTGGISNGGLIAATGIGINLQGNIFNGGINNSGTILSSSTGVVIGGTTFNGGVINTGTIIGTTGIYVTATTFNGGINNSGVIDGQSEGAIHISSSNTTFTGGIVNSGTLLGSSDGIYVGNTAFTGGILNSGTILVSSNGIEVSNTTFTGGINNSGSIISGTSTAVTVSVTTFQGDFINSGLIRSGTGGGAVDLSATTFDGNFTNSGTIDGGTDNGVSIDVTNWVGNFGNTGQILSTTDLGVEIAASTWTGNFSSSGLIDSYSPAVNIDVGTSWVGNFLNSGTVISRNSSAVIITGSTWTGNFTNNGSIRALTDTAIHVDLNDFTGNFTNTGLIEAVDNGVLFDLATFTGDFSNSGSITSATSEAVRFNITTFHGNIVNTGLIRGLQDAVKLNGGMTLEGDILNTGGTIRSLNEDAVDVNGVVEGKLVNTGVIHGLRDGIDVDNQIQGGIFTSGTIIGQTGNAIDLSGATIAHNVTQTGGLIDGDFDMNNTFADIYYANDGEYRGDIEADANDIISVGPHSPMAFSAGTLDGADLIDFISGEGVIGSAAIGVDGTGFDITNTNYMRVRQNAIAYLDDNTTIDLNNDLTLDGATLGVNLPASTLMYYVTPNEAVHGQINATGTAFLDGNLVAVPGNGLFTEGLSYTYVGIITGTISGTFENVSASSIFFEAFADYNANSVDLRVVRRSFADGLLAVGGSQNEVATANALDEIFDAGGFSGDFNDLRNYLLAFGTDTEAARVLDDINGAEHAQFQRALLTVADGFNQGVAARLDVTKVSLRNAQWSSIDARYAASETAGVATDGGPSSFSGTHGLTTRGRNGISIWGRGTGTFASVDGDTNAAGYDQDGGGLTGGIDYSSSPSSVFGLAGAWQTSNVDFDTPGDSGDIDSWHVGAYGSFGTGDFYLDTTIGAGSYDVQSTRFVSVGMFTGNALGDYSAWSGGATAAIGTVLTDDNYSLQPSVAVAYTHLEVDGFTETGAGVFNLIVDDTDADSLASTVGLRASAVWTSGRTRLLPEVSVGWRHEFLDDTHSFTGAFQEDPSTLFNIVSSDISPDSLLFGVGLTAAVSQQVELFVDYKGAYSNDADSHNGSVGARLAW